MYDLNSRRLPLNESVWDSIAFWVDSLVFWEAQNKDEQSMRSIARAEQMIDSFLFNEWV